MTALHNKHVLVTGGASGIGRLLVLACAGSGAAVTIWDLDEAGAERVALEAVEAGASSALAFACDVGDREQVYARAEELREAAGDVDVLVNNAGIVSGRTLLDLPDEKIERTFAVNTLALFWTTKAFLPAMIARGSGHVVTVASAAGLMGSARETDYAASKFAAVGFNEALRMELRRNCPGVRTTVVCPYYIDTGMFEGARTRFPFLLPILKEQDVADRILGAIRRNDPKVEMPWMVRTLPVMRLLPVWALDQLADFFGLNNAMDAFTGRSASESVQREEVVAGSAGG